MGGWLPGYERVRPLYWDVCGKRARRAGDAQRAPTSPLGWEERIEVRHYGALEIHLTSRFDQICFKLYAATDRGPDDKHFHDLVQLRPTKEELLTAAAWTRTHDPSEGFRTMLIGCLDRFGVEADDVAP